MKTAWNSKVRKREVKSGHKILFLEIPTRRPVDWSAYRKSPYCDLLRIIASNSLILFQNRCRNSINHNNLKQTAISNNERPMNLKNLYAVCPIKAYLSPPSAWYCLTIFFEISTVPILKHTCTSPTIGLQTNCSRCASVFQDVDRGYFKKIISQYHATGRGRITIYRINLVKFQRFRCTDLEENAH